MKKRLHQIELFTKYPAEVQEEIRSKLVSHAALTEFGQHHNFLSLKNVEDFKKAVPVRSYSGFKTYIDRLREGEQSVLWPSKLRWFAKSSGTTSGKSKFIPVSKEALEDCHFKGGKDLLAMYYHQREDARLYSGKHLVMGGSSKIMSYNKDCYTGDLSAIIIKNLPMWVELRRAPSREIALLDNWEEKIERMADTIMQEDIAMVAGVPSWTLVLFKRIMEKAGVDDIHDIWPNLQMFVHGGVSFKPYREQFETILKGRRMDYLETYNASEGFFGVQDRVESDDMLLMLDYGIYYEFMPMEEYGKEFPETLELKDVEIGKNYALIISTNAGLWRYLIGDTIKFTSKAPYRIQVSGRTKHFINAFGEEVIVENADEALRFACEKTQASVVDYTAAPIYMTSEQTGGHEWLIEFEKEPFNMMLFSQLLDQRLKEINTDYAAKRSGNLSLRPPVVKSVAAGTFYDWLSLKNKLGGQHKVPRLFNDRTYIDQILSCVLES